MSILLLCLFFVVTAYSQQTSTGIPLDRNDWSYQRGDTSSLVVVEYIIDLTCSSTMDAWPVIQQVSNLYNDYVKFQYRVMPLPYHQQGFIVAKAAQLVKFYTDGKGVFTFMNTAIVNQPAIYNTATADMTYNEVVRLVETWAVNGTGLTSAQYYEGMDRDNDSGNIIEMNTRYMWKFATSHGYYGTPIYAVNGLNVDGLETVEEWQEVLNSLLKSGYTE
jgi:hypothetical protein